MAQISVKRPDIYPDGTVVKAWNATAFHSGQSGAPSGASVGEVTISSGEGTISGLQSGTEYVLYASVGGVDRFLFVTPSAAVSTLLTDIGDVTSKTSAEIDALLPITSSGEQVALATGLVSAARVLLIRKTSSGKWWKVALTEIA